jgi:excisionase family DNA binding protein
MLSHFKGELALPTTSSTGPSDGLPLLVKPKKAAALLGVSVGTVYNLLGNGDLASLKLRGARMITTASIQSFIDKRLATAERPRGA